MEDSLECNTSESDAVSIATIQQQIPYGEYFKIPIEGSEIWQYFNPITHIWSFVERTYGNQSKFLLFRNGWIVRRLGRAGNKSDYYMCYTNDFIPISINDAEIIVIENSIGYIKLPEFCKEGNLFLLTRDVYLPRNSFFALKNMAIHTSENNGLIEVMVFPETKKEEIYNILNNIKISTYQSDTFHEDFDDLKNQQKEDFILLLKNISDIFALAYSGYLKCEDRIEDLIIQLSHRNWDEFQPPELGIKLKEIFELADSNKIAKAVLDYFIYKLPLFFDWKENGNEEIINGVIIEGTPLEYQKKWANNYFKLIVPHLESTLYWQTTMSPTNEGVGWAHSLQSRLLGVNISRWRIYPYLGKVKFTGNKKDIEFYNKSIPDIKYAFNSIAGNPSFEVILRDYAYFDGFNLDYSIWKGSFQFNRYFLAIVKIENYLKIDSAFPITLVTDIFGNHFEIQWDIDSYFHDKEIIHQFGKGGWISVLLENELNSVDDDCVVPLFKSVQNIGPLFVKMEDAYYLNILGIIKYCGFISEDGLNKLMILSNNNEEFIHAIDKLVSDGKIIRKNGFYFYIHNILNHSQAEYLCDLTSDPNQLPERQVQHETWYELWSRLRTIFPYIHPLIRGCNLFETPIRNQYSPDSKQYSLLFDFIQSELRAHNKLRTRAHRVRFEKILGVSKDLEFFETLVGKLDDNRYVNHASLMLMNYGYAIIKSRGRWISKAHMVANRIERHYAFMDPVVTRTDYIETRQDGRLIPSVEFNIRIFGLEEI